MYSIPTINLGEPLSAGCLLHQRQLATSPRVPSATLPPPPLPSQPPSALLGRLQKVFATDEAHKMQLQSQDESQPRSQPYVGPEETVSSVVDGADELTWSPKKIAWTRGVELVRTFSFEGRAHVRQAFFAWFDIGSPSALARQPEDRETPAQASGTSSVRHLPPSVASVRQSQTRQPTNTFSSASSIAYSSSPSLLANSGTSRARAVCFVYGDELEIHFASGDRHIVHLPFPFGHAWPLNTGILMQSSIAQPTTIDALGYSSEQTSLYSLTDRFGEPRPVATLQSQQSPQTEAADPLGPGTEILLVASRSSPVPIVVAKSASTGDVLILHYSVRDVSSATSHQPLRHAKPSPPVVPPPSLPRPRGRASLSQVRRRHSSLGPSDSFAHPSHYPGGPSNTSVHPARTPVSGATRSAPEQDPKYSKMSRGAIPLALDPSGIQDRRLSLGRTDLNKSMDRMVLDGDIDELGIARGPVGAGDGEDEAAGSLELTVIFKLKQVASREKLSIEASICAISSRAATLSVLDRSSDLLSAFAVSLLSQPGGQPSPTTISIVPTGTRSCVCATSSPAINDHRTLLLDKRGSMMVLNAQTGVATAVRAPFTRPQGISREQASRRVLQLDIEHAPERHSRTRGQPVEGLQEAPSHTTILSSRDGSSTSVRMPRAPDGLVGRCLDALSFSLDDVQTSQLRAGLARSGGGRATEWEPFVELLLTILGLRSESIAPSPARRLPWDRLQQSPVQAQDPALVSLRSITQSPSRSRDDSASAAESSAPSDIARLATVTRSLHLLAEDCKLSLVRLVDLEKLGPLIARLAAALGREDWVDYWFRAVPAERGSDWYRPETPDSSELLPSPPDIYTHLSSILHRRPLTQAWISLADLAAPRPPSLPPRQDPCTLTEGLLTVYSELGKASSSSDPVKQAADAVRCIVDQGITLDKLLQLPFGVSLPLHEVIRACQASPPSDWPAAAYALVQRPDMSTRTGVTVPTSSKRLDVSALDVSSITALTATTSSKRTPAPSSAPTAKTASSSEQTLRFGSDRRVEEVERMLSTTRTVTIALPARLGMSDQEITVAQKAAALALAQRTSAISVGQGVFAFGTCSATLTRSWPIPPVDLSVRVLPQNVQPVVDVAALGEGAREWSSFHNGVAAGLRISPESPAVDSSWVVFNRPAEQGSTHAGFLLGLGLTGHLRGMMPWHAFPYLDSRHDFTSIGVLLGLASSYAGSQDALLTKILSLHVHALLPYGSRELNASPLTQAAALLGIGILYTGSRNRRMAEIALSEITRSVSAPQDPLTDHREAYAFSAAMSFGTVMVGQGGADQSARDLEMVSQLRLGIFGSSPAAAGGKEPIVDVNITGPGATAALGLMYLRSNRQDMAAILDLPRSRFDLDLVRPDILLVRTLSRSLILWSIIAPSQDWVESNVPSFIRSSLKKRKRDGVALDHGVETAYFNILAGACFAIGLKYAGTARSTVHSLLLHYYDLFWKASNVAPTSFEHRIRLSTARACLNVVAISLAVVMAGTGELSVLSRLRLAHGQSDKGVSFGSHMAIHMALGILFLGRGRYTLGSSDAAIAAMVCAFFPRFNHAQGDNLSYPQAYRHLWALAVEPRCFVARDVDSGESVYLPIKVKLEEDGVVGSHHLISPTLLPPVERLVSVKIDSPRYWPVHLDPVGSPQDRTMLTQNDPVRVKRRAGFLSYAADPKGNRSIFVQAGLIGAAPDLGAMTVSRGSSAVGLEAVRELVPSLTPDPFLVAFFRRLCAGTSKPSPPSTMSDFAGAAFLECLISDQPQILRLYLQVHQLQFTTPTASFLPLLLRNLQMAQHLPSAAQARLPPHHRSSTSPVPILRTSLLRQVETAISALVNNFRIDSSFRTLLARYAQSRTDSNDELSSAEDRTKLALYFVSAGVPSQVVLSTLRYLVQEARRQTSQLTPDVGGATAEESVNLEKGLRIVVGATARRVGGLDAQPWEERSVEEILGCW